MYLLDINICIFALNGRRPKLTEKLLTIHPKDICISSVTVSELEYGAAKSKWGEKTKSNMLMFLANYDIIPFTEADAVICGDIRGQLAIAGTPIGVYDIMSKADSMHACMQSKTFCEYPHEADRRHDIMIAAQGLSRNYTVITNNTREFERVPNLNIEDWTV